MRVFRSRVRMFSNRMDQISVSEMKHIIENGLLTKLFVACLVSLVSVCFVWVDWLLPILLSISIPCLLWVTLQLGAIAYNGTKREKSAREREQRVRKAIIQILDENGPMSYEDLETHHKEIDEGGSWFYRYYSDHKSGPHKYEIKDILDIYIDICQSSFIFSKWDAGEVEYSDLDFRIRRLRASGSIEWTDGKYQHRRPRIYQEDFE